MPRGNGTNPSPRRKPNVGRLNTVTSVRQEMARVYREARRGDITAQDASKLVYALSLIAKTLERTDWEGRLQKLEEAYTEQRRRLSSPGSAPRGE